METSISAILVQCLKSFNQLAEQVELPEYKREAEVSRTSWGDELGRLRVWAANIGAHQTGQSSLSFRLRDASHISNQITKLLEDLEQSLCATFDELSEHELVASDEEDDARPGHETTTELQQLYEEVVNIVDCLYQMSMLIRKPAQHDMLIGSRMGDQAHFEVYDQQHVRDRHPRIEEHIGQRLGRAITRRRKYLFYRERHHKKLEKGIEDVQGIQRATTGSVLSETTATDFKAPNIDFEETSSNSGISETSYAPSLIDGGQITIPPPPRDSMRGKPFECPYCFFIIDIQSTRSWNRHLFKDIKPYVCTFPNCGMPDRLYDSRREWYYHETTEHCREGFVCPLCRKTLESSKQCERHVARHLEELALFALPRTEKDYEEDDNDDNFDAKDSTTHTNDSSSERSSPEGEEWEMKEVVTYPAYADQPAPAVTTPPPPLSASDTSKEDEKYARIERILLEQEAKQLEREAAVEEAAKARTAKAEAKAKKAEEISKASAAAATAAREEVVKQYQATEKDKAAKAEAEAQKAEEIANASASAAAAAREEVEREYHATAAAIAKPPAPLKQKDKPIKFKDTIGRRFNFPFNICNTWSGMEYCIKEAFLHVADLGPRVAAGEYDLIGPKDEIIKPSIWESVIEPGWEITMHMWPMLEPLPTIKFPLPSNVEKFLMEKADR
ncbi:hypothetical protein BDR22DRAFT_820756 [Usnea florida]